MNKNALIVKPNCLFLGALGIFIALGIFGFVFSAKALTACEISCGVIPPTWYDDYCADHSQHLSYVQDINAECMLASEAGQYDGWCYELSPIRACCANGNYKPSSFSKKYWITGADCYSEFLTCVCNEYQPTTCAGGINPECRPIGTSCGSSGDCCGGAICKNGYCGTLGSCLPGTKSCSCDSQCCSGDCSSGMCTGESGGGLPDGSYCVNESECSGGYCCDNACSSASCGYTCFTKDTNCLGQESRCCSGLSCQLPWWSCQCIPCPDSSTYCPGQTAQDGCGNVCPNPGTKICDPGPPTNFGHSGNTINTITWSWSEPLPDYYGTVTKYQLFDSSGSLLIDNLAPGDVCSGSDCSWQEINLSANTQYARYAKACNLDVCSDISNTASAYTSVQSVASAVCSSITTNSIQVTAYSAGGLGFSNLTSGFSGILFQNPGYTWWQSNVYTFSGLTPNTLYNFTIGPSKNGDGENTVDSVGISCSTNTALPIPDAPANLHHTANTVNSIDWEWNASPGADYYKLYSWADTRTWRWKADIIATNYRQTDSYFDATGWTALSSNTMYGYAVSSCNASGCSGLSSSDAATSMPKPTDISCSNITTNSIRAIAAGTFLNINLGSSGIVFREAGGATQDSQSTVWDLLGLIPDTNYSFFVKARNQEGDLTDEFGPKACSTLAPTIYDGLRIYGPSDSIIKLALINLSDALLLNRGTVKAQRRAGDVTKAAWLVEKNDPNASPVRVMTPFGIKAWRIAP